MVNKLTRDIGVETMVLSMCIEREDFERYKSRIYEIEQENNDAEIKHTLYDNKEVIILKTNKNSGSSYMLIHKEDDEGFHQGAWLKLILNPARILYGESNLDLWNMNKQSIYDLYSYIQDMFYAVEMEMEFEFERFRVERVDIAYNMYCETIKDAGLDIKNCSEKINIETNECKYEVCSEYYAMFHDPEKGQYSDMDWQRAENMVRFKWQLGRSILQDMEDKECIEKNGFMGYMIPMVGRLMEGFFLEIRRIWDQYKNIYTNEILKLLSNEFDNSLLRKQKIHSYIDYFELIGEYEHSPVINSDELKNNPCAFEHYIGYKL